MDTVIERIVYRGRIQTNNKRQELALRLNVLTNPYPLMLLFVNLTTTFQEIQYVFNTSINKVIMYEVLVIQILSDLKLLIRNHIEVINKIALWIIFILVNK